MKLNLYLINCLVCMLISWGIAQVPDCDPLLPIPKNHPQPYGPKGQTCEGVYIQEVSSTSIIALAILTEGASTRSLLAGHDVKMTWTAPESLQDIKVRAQGIRRQLYYRMDTRIEAQKREFDWNTSIINSLSISLVDIGLSAWIPEYSESIDRLFIPLRLSQENVAEEHLERYTVAIMPSQELDELSYALSRESEEIIRLIPLEYGYYPNDRPILFYLMKNELRDSGVYKLQLVAEPKRGPSRALTIWFYHDSSQ